MPSYDFIDLSMKLLMLGENELGPGSVKVIAEAYVIHNKDNKAEVKEDCKEKNNRLEVLNLGNYTI